MSALRTARRQLKSDKDRRDLPGNRAIKPGTYQRQIISNVQIGDYEMSLHATKGFRVVRNRAA